MFASGWITHLAADGARAVDVGAEVHSLVRGLGVEEGSDLVGGVADKGGLDGGILRAKKAAADLSEECTKGGTSDVTSHKRAGLAQGCRV